MQVLVGIAGALAVLLVLWEAFETIVLPRRVTRHFRFTRLFYRWTWLAWRELVGGVRDRRRRETFLSVYGPASLLALIASWAVMLVVGFALLHWALEIGLRSTASYRGFWTDVYFSGTNFFTLGLGDMTPTGPLGRFLTVIEAGTGFAFLAVVIGYIPSIYQSFSRRETNITLLDARAGSPPTAGEMLRRYASEGGIGALNDWLRDWEGWAADLLESHLSYPVLCYFRSQHDNQSWLTALTAILDTCALVLSGVDGVARRQARLTFAIARHAVVDLAQIFRTRPVMPPADRLSPEQFARLRKFLTRAGLTLADSPDAQRHLRELRDIYEPYVFALAEYMQIRLPDWMPAAERADNWQTSAWGRIIDAAAPAGTSPQDDHF